jgi:hypothetical protein
MRILKMYEKIKRCENKYQFNKLRKKKTIF